MPKHHTVGKVTYLRAGDLPPRTTLEQLEAAEAHPDVTTPYPGADLHAAFGTIVEPDEFDVWQNSHDRLEEPHSHVNWRLIGLSLMLVSAIIVIVALGAMTTRVIDLAIYLHNSGFPITVTAK